jgi:hypothetical protein
LGTTARLIDITALVQKQYNERIARDFICKAGSTLDVVSKFQFYSPEVAGTLRSLDEDVALQNTQTSFKTDGTGYELMDRYSYPKLDSVTDVPPITEDGDKY